MMLNFFHTQGLGIAFGVAIGLLLAGILAILGVKLLLIVLGRKENIFFPPRPPRIAEQSGKPVSSPKNPPKPPSRISTRTGHRPKV